MYKTAILPFCRHNLHKENPFSIVFLENKTILNDLKMFTNMHALHASILHCRYIGLYSNATGNKKIRHQNSARKNDLKSSLQDV